MSAMEEPGGVGVKNKKNVMVTTMGEIIFDTVRPPKLNTTSLLAMRQMTGAGRGLRAYSGAGRQCRVPVERMASTIAWYVCACSIQPLCTCHTRSHQCMLLPMLRLLSFTGIHLGCKT